jgi:predicted adenylyl cyclase CyaB
MYDEGKKLFEKDARLRLRKKVDLRSNQENTEISYKKPLTREGIKIEEEYETSVGKFREMEEIFANIGFTKVSSYDRIRDTFLIEGLKVTVDSFIFGDYLEIEGDIEKIQKLAEELGLDMKNNITKSCDDIYDEICKAEGKPTPDHILFESSEALEKEKEKRAVLLK